MNLFLQYIAILTDKNFHVTVLSREESWCKGEGTWTWGWARGKISKNKSQIQNVKGKKPPLDIFIPCLIYISKFNGTIVDDFKYKITRLRGKLERSKKCRHFSRQNKSPRDWRMLKGGNNWMRSPSTRRTADCLYKILGGPARATLFDVYITHLGICQIKI